MTSRKYSILILTLAFGATPLPAVGAENGFFSEELRQIGVGYVNYGGNRDQSVGGNTGYALLAGISRGNSFVQLLTRLRLEYSTGTATFPDGTSTPRLDYRLIETDASFGLRIFPVMSRDGGFGIYFGGAGSFGIAHLALPDRAYSQLNTSQMNTTLGYDLFGGIEIGTGGSGSRRRLFIEAALKTIRTEIGSEKRFALDGFLLLGGLAW